jgi:hypothetical protein
VEFPPRAIFRSSNVTWVPPSISVWAAESPESPPPTTIAEGIVLEVVVARPAGRNVRREQGKVDMA